MLAELTLSQVVTAFTAHAGQTAYATVRLAGTPTSSTRQDSVTGACRAFTSTPKATVQVSEHTYTHVGIVTDPHSLPQGMRYLWCRPRVYGTHMLLVRAKPQPLHHHPRYMWCHDQLWHWQLLCEPDLLRKVRWRGNMNPL